MEGKYKCIAAEKYRTIYGGSAANDRRLALFEGVYKVPDGVSYNSYLLLDEKTVVFDTVDKTVSDRFFENLEHVLENRSLDYLVVQHMEPDHSATMVPAYGKIPGYENCLQRQNACHGKAVLPGRRKFR